MRSFLHLITVMAGPLIHPRLQKSIRKFSELVGYSGTKESIETSKLSRRARQVTAP